MNARHLRTRLLTRLHAALILFCLCSFSFMASAQDIILRNVTIPDTQVDGEDVAVSIVISGGVLELISQEIDLDEENYLIYNAERGILLGQLEIGNAPSFLILNGDPREDFDILLDTFTYATFAIERGTVRRNNLRADFARSENRRTGWISYSAPPVSLPVALRNARRWNHWDNDITTGLLSGAIILDRQNWLHQTRASEMQVGDLDNYDGGELRGFRLGVVGRLNTKMPIGYTFFAATNAYGRGFDSKETDDLSFFDYRLDFPLTANTTIAIGKQKEPISMSRVGLGLAAPVVDERPPVVEAFLPSRNTGALYSYAAPNGRSSYALGVFNDWLEDDGSFSDNSTSITGRASWLPYLSEDEQSLFHLAIAHKNMSVEGVGSVGVEPEFNLAPEFVEIDFLDVEKNEVTATEAAYKTGPFSLIGEYFRADLQTESMGNPSYDGYYISANWALTGENRPYNKRNGSFGAYPMSRSTSNGGWGTLETAVRYSHLDMDDGAFDAGEMDILSLGINWWITDSFTAGFYYRFVEFEQFGTTGSSNGFTSRLVFVLQ